MAELSHINKLRTMNAISLYIQTCRYVMQAKVHDLSSWEDLHRFLPVLRQSLSCCVCLRVLRQPMGPAEGICHHHVCRDCRGGKMRLRPSCSWCKEWQAFVENPQLKIIVQCFKKLCHYLAASAFAQHLKEDQNSGAISLYNIIQEGCDMKDDYSGSNGQSSSLSMLPIFPSTNSECTATDTATAPPPVIENHHRKFTVKVEDPTSSETLVSCASRGCSSQENTQENKERSRVSSTCDSTENDVTSSNNTSLQTKSRNHEGVGGRGRVVVPLHTALTIDTTVASTTPELNGCDEEEAPDIEDRISEKHSHLPHHGAASLHHNYSSSEPASSGPNSPMYEHSARLCHNVSAEHDYNSSLTAIYSVSMTSDEAPKLKIRRTDRAGPGVSPARADLSSPERSPDLIPRLKSSPEKKNKALRKKSKHRQKSKGCRCGLATPNPGKLTCCGQRCPCYSAFRGCLPDCKCRGCKNTRNSYTTPVLPSISVVPTVIDNNQAESDDDSFIIEVDD